MGLNSSATWPLLTLKRSGSIASGRVTEVSESGIVTEVSESGIVTEVSESGIVTEVSESA